MHIRSLQQQLTQFGLDPAEWILEVTRRMGPLTRFDIHSRVSQDLSFEGWAKQDLWVMLRLREV